MKGIQKGIQFKSLVARNRYGLYLHEYQAYDLLKKYKLPLVPVHYQSFRALGQALLRTLTQLHRDSWQRLLKTNHLWMLLSKLRFMQEEEEKELLKNPA